jgi:prepilin-type N-terminal cleavage/methylation domain-containing protein
MKRYRLMSERWCEAGFTLIELLVVVIILGVLAGIALPTYLNQREKAWRTAAVSDLRSAAVIMENFFDDQGTYLPVGAIQPGVTPPYAFHASGDASGNVEVSLPVAGITTATRYCLEADHIKLNGAGTADYHMDSLEGRPGPGPC